MFTDEPKAWEPGSFKTRQRFHAFAHVRDLPQAERSLKAAYNQHRTQCLGKSGERGASGRWELWSREDDWVGRLELWDGEVDHQKRDRFLKAQLEAVERHVRAAQAAITVATIPVRAILNRLSDPAFRAALDTQAPWPMLRDSWRALQILPALITAERQALGLTTMELVVADRRAVRDPIADAIVSDPLALDAAIALLDRAARAKPDDV